MEQFTNPTLRTPQARPVRNPCWHCAYFVAMVDGISAFCANAECVRCRSAPWGGCSAYRREPGTDDEPNAPQPVGLIRGWQLAPSHLVRPPRVLEALRTGQWPPEDWKPPR